MPELYFKFDETTGTVAEDASGNGRVGTLVGGPTRVAGTRGNALSFDGVNDVVTTTWPGVLGTGPNSVAFWLRTTSTATQFIIAWGEVNGSRSRYDLGLNLAGRSAGQHSLVFGSSAVASAWDGRDELFDGNWHHVCVTKAANAGYLDLLLYVDGVLIGTPVSSAGSGNTALNILSNSPLRVGAWHFGGDWFNGALDDLRVYAEALDAAGVSGVMASGSSFQGGVRGRASTANSFDRAVRGVAAIGFDPMSQMLRGASTSFAAMAGRSAGRSAVLESLETTTRGRCRVLIGFSGALRGLHIRRNAMSGRARGLHGMALACAVALRGRSRSADDAMDRYELFVGSDAAADPTGPPLATFANLPFLTPALDPGHAYQFLLRRRNRWGLSSENLSAWALVLGADGQPLDAPQGPEDVTLTPSAAGTAVLTARYASAADPNAGDTWAVYLTDDGLDPDPLTTTAQSQPLGRGDGVARLRLVVAARPEGTTVKALVRLRRSGTPPVESVNTTPVSCVVTSVGPPTVDGPMVLIGTVAGQQQ